MTFALHRCTPNHDFTGEKIKYWILTTWIFAQLSVWELRLVYRWFCASLWNAFCAWKSDFIFLNLLVVYQEVDKIELNQQGYGKKFMSGLFRNKSREELGEKYNLWLWRYKFLKEVIWLKKIEG